MFEVVVEITGGGELTGLSDVVDVVVVDESSVKIVDAQVCFVCCDLFDDGFAFWLED